MTVTHHGYSKLRKAMPRDNVLDHLVTLLIDDINQEETLAVAEQEKTRIAKVAGGPHRNRP